MDVAVPGHVYPQQQPRWPSSTSPGPGYLRAMRIPLRKGRTSAIATSPGAAPTMPIIINETLARTLFPDENAVGRRSRRPARNALHHRRRSGGCASDAGRRPPVPADGQLPFEGQGGPIAVDRQLGVAARDARRLAEAAIDRADQSVADHGGRELSGPGGPRRLAAAIPRSRCSAGLPRSACCWRVSAIYGVISYSVAQRRQEIGVRMALGATAGRVQSQVMRETLRLGRGRPRRRPARSPWRVAPDRRAALRTSPGRSGGVRRRRRCC